MTDKYAVIGNPIAHSKEEGQVFYDGELYEKVFMRYDLLQEKLVVEIGRASCRERVLASV